MLTIFVTQPDISTATYSNPVCPSRFKSRLPSSVFSRNSPSAHPSQGNRSRDSHGENCPCGNPWSRAAYPLAQELQDLMSFFSSQTVRFAFCLFGSYPQSLATDSHPPLPSRFSQLPSGHLDVALLWDSAFSSSPFRADIYYPVRDSTPGPCLLGEVVSQKRPERSLFLQQECLDTDISPNTCDKQLLNILFLKHPHIYRFYYFSEQPNSSFSELVKNKSVSYNRACRCVAS